MPQKNESRIYGDVKLFKKKQKHQRQTVQINTDTDAQVLNVAQTLGMIPPGSVPQPAPELPPELLPNPPDQDADGWEDIDDVPEYLREFIPNPPPHSPIIDPDCNNFYRRHRGLLAIQQRSKLSNAWKSLLPQLTVIYLERQHHTLNWSTHTSYLNYHPKCSCMIFTTREFDLVGLAGRMRKQVVRVCSCMSLPMRLMHYGYLAGSPNLPTVAFSIPVVQLFHELWKKTTLSLSGFLEGYMVFLDSRSEKYLHTRNSNYTNQNLRRQFTQAVDVYRSILKQQKMVYQHALNLSSSQKLADQCPRCFGPACGEVKTSPKELDFILAMDGNFQHRHHLKASTDQPAEEDYPSLFITPLHISIHERKVEDTASQAKGLKTACSESHTAADDVRNSSSWEQCDDTGVFGSTCRHDVPLRFVNIYKSGEKLHYAITILDNILEAFPEARVGCLYDIGCHLDVHMEKRKLLPQYRDQLAFATSVFHAYAHQWPCQIMYHPRFIKHFGLSDGEGLERLWSFLSDLVSLNRVCTRLHRLQSINIRAELYGEELTFSSAKWLVKKYHNAVEVFGLSQNALLNLYKLNNPANDQRYLSKFFREQWESERAAQGSKNHHLDILRLKLVNLLCLRDNFQKQWAINFNAEQEAMRVQTLITLNQQIQEASQKVGSAGDTIFANKDHKEVMLKLWSSKHELRKKFISVCEEKRPLQLSRTDGRSSNLGTSRKSIVINAVKKHAMALKGTLETYLTQLANYRKVFPTNIVPDPALMDHNRLLVLEPDAPFWNDGFITHANEPWAIDPNTQHGMRQLAYYERSKEELRRIGWEIRQSMRWATQQHISLMDIFQDLRKSEPTSDAARAFLSSPFLSSPDPTTISDAETVIVWTRLVDVLHLQEVWNLDLMEIFLKTDLQDGDGELLEQWNSQVALIARMRANGSLTPVLGNFSTITVESFESDSDPDATDTDHTTADEIESSDAGSSDDEELRILEELNEEDALSALSSALNLTNLNNDDPDASDVPLPFVN
ncbi:uncharacterized protein MELLADRAFT_86843 [Melampsora larici-populina 98AG31]|uniref:CxC1-like cysteine cluster associated with KDZ transposases domain-containing protein n=1 Tax=Melampsora larici-populina (strain 98AG31 / pathotype 3-4-7) TaxID=747676 RepID=F4R3L2_MELLP|nr:uncharacterized protein MELLADRAFT_86843 [Melampsora larici-populina 98AG31]EGG12645.1 hypothetical protein MELLADRAFT_86843 [Melampsora larici-populina 98AG31]